ncbi:hypothetical protein ACHAXT_005998 [Thalassiosira profunda]
MAAEAPPPSGGDATAAYQRYLLDRLGLLPDEVDWPSKTAAGEIDGASSADVRLSGSSGGVGGSAWRARDPLSSLLGDDARVTSEGGATPLETSMQEVAEGDKSKPAATLEPELISLASILDPLLPPKPYPNPMALDVNVAKKAFDAAALAVVRGSKRSLEAPTAEGSAAADASNETAAAAPNSDDNTKTDSNEGYAPPLLLAAEAIRASRRQCLDAAAHAPSVPQFLKKNNTIPWFHVPLVARGGRNAPSGSGMGEGRAGTPSSLAGSPDKVGSAMAAFKKEGDGKTGQGQVQVHSGFKKEGSKKRNSGEASPGDQGASTSKRPKSDDDDTVHPPIPKKKSPAAGKTPKGSDKKRARTKILTPSSSAAILTPSSAASKPLPSPEAGRKKRLAGVRTPSSVEDALRLSGNAATARAIIGAAASGVFRELDPEREANRVSDDEAGMKREVATLAGIAAAANTNTPGKKKGDTEKKGASVNVADVLSRAKKLGDGASDKARGTARRGDQRREFRGNGARARSGVALGGGAGGGRTNGGEAQGGAAASPFVVRPAHALPLVVPNPFVTAAADGGSAAMDVDAPNNRSSAAAHPPTPSTTPTDPEWTQSCRPRLLSILGTGAGHAVWHDRQWDGRAERAADVLRHLAVPRETSGGAHGASTRAYPNYGPHLVVTAAADFSKFASAFARLDEGLAVVAKTEEANDASTVPTDPDDVLLRALPYRGSTSQRRRLRRHFGSLMPPPQSPAAFLAGLPDSPFHVILTTYTALTEDFVHFSHIPFQAVILDEGLGWLGCAGSDPGGTLGKVWHDALWNASDAADGALEGGKVAAPWDFGKDVDGLDLDITEGAQPRPRRGLTARHRVLLASAMHARHKDQIYRAPVLGLLSFLSPPLADAIKDEWERSRVFGCPKTLSYIRSAVARAIVVYAGDATVRPPADLVALAARALEGALPSRFPRDLGREDVGVDALVQSRKIGHSRKDAAAWFRPSSAMRAEVAAMTLDPLLAMAKKLNGQGHCCEEMVTSSSLTPAGMGGAVLGLSAYRPAVRCGRVFSSEQGLKQHIMSVHAPPGTWLCRYCAGDCGTSQARASHERTCGSLQGGGSAAGSKKKDGNRRVTGYKGVWVRLDKKYFVKVDGQPVTGDGDAPLLFDSAEAAATKFDEVMADKRDAQESEPNYTSDSSGGAVLDEEDDDDAPPAAKVAKKTGHGTVINYTVPALAEIDIKNLPPHIKPLLRDPAWTPRTQGSKRYVYAYRGVCRQQRKGHDRWQSQISCDGTNHYLGTFDSEWDAAACYAWAHLILYGEEATEKARLEGEEAVAAYERQQRDVAEGKIPPPEPKKKKARRSTPKKGIGAVAEAAASGGTPKGGAKADTQARSPNADLQPPSSVRKKKTKTMSMKQWGKLKTDVAFMLSSGTKGTSKTTLLTTRKDIADMSERLLLHHVSGHFLSASDNFLRSIQTAGRKFKLPACVPLSRFAPPLRGERSRALLMGLPPGEFGWEVEKFIAACATAGAANAAGSFATLSVEFGAAGANKSFRAMLLSKSCTLGRASKPSPINLSSSSVQAESTLGMPVGSLDCNVGGPEHSCSERAAKIEYLPSAHSNFQFMACNDDDIVTLNGQRVSAKSGPLPLKHRDICGVGARVFVFIEKTA